MKNSGKQFQISCCHISFFGDLPSKSWDLFACKKIIESDLVVSLLSNTNFGTVLKLFIPTVSPSHVLVIGEETVLCTKDWRRGEIIPGENVFMIDTLIRNLFYTHAVRRQMIQLHCATIEDQGRGILFLGPSGIGKTTQAERWAEFRGSSIINGDVGFVQRTEREYIAWGTPWHGSSPYCLNTSVPVKALVVLKQAQENKLRELTGFEKVAEVSGSVFYPTWLEDGMDLCTDTLNHLLTDLPVYRLDNRADREAVELLARELDRIS